MATDVRRGARAAMILTIGLATGALGYGVAAAAGQLQQPAATVRPTAERPTVGTQPTPPAGTAVPEPTATSEPTAAGNPTAPAEPTEQATEAAPPPAVLERGDHGPRVRSLQARLRQIAWFSGNVTDSYGPATAAAVAGFQAKRGLPDLGYVDSATLDRLEAMTRTPSADELANKVDDGTSTSAALDPRCTTGRSLCIDKTSRTIRWVVDGEVHRTMAVRFGASYTPTREGLFHVESKSRDHVSSLFGSAMPFAMFFSRGQAVHYSSDFAARGYAGASHGCVNVRDRAGLAALFDEVRVGDKVVVYRS
ncbi:MAG: hypothetical protein JWQ74_1113 [Marmoricola sp.]|nr:hypothetical protein [Marmoricola sp.]